MNSPPRAAQRLFELGTCGSISERSGAGSATRAAALAARGRAAPMNRTASDSADCAAPFQPTPDAAMHAGSPAVHRSAARRGAETSKRAGTISSSHRRDSADRRERHRFRTHGMPRARVAMRRGTAGRHAASRRDSARRRARVPRISAIDPAPPPQAVPFHRRAALRQAGTSRPPFRSFQEMHRSKLPAQSFPFAHRRPFPL